MMLTFLGLGSLGVCYFFFFFFLISFSLQEGRCLLYLKLTIAYQKQITCFDFIGLKLEGNCFKS